MHNNGTSRLILPERNLLPDLQPKAGIKVQVTPQGVLLSTQLGENVINLIVNSQDAANLGVQLISAGAMHLHLAAQPGGLVVSTEPPPASEPEPETPISID